MVDALTVESDEGRGKTAISFGEMSNNHYYPEISEWGNLSEQTSEI